MEHQLTSLRTHFRKLAENNSMTHTLSDIRHKRMNVGCVENDSEEEEIKSEWSKKESIKLGVNKAKRTGKKLIVFGRYLERVFVRSQQLAGGLGGKEGRVVLWLWLHSKDIVKIKIQDDTRAFPKVFFAHLCDIQKSRDEEKMLFQLPSTFIFRMSISSLISSVLETNWTNRAYRFQRKWLRTVRAPRLLSKVLNWFVSSSKLGFCCSSASAGVADLSQTEQDFTWLALLPLLGLADSDFWSRQQPDFSAGLLADQL